MCPLGGSSHAECFTALPPPSGRWRLIALKAFMFHSIPFFLEGLWTMSRNIFVFDLLTASWTPRNTSLPELCSDVPVQAELAEVMTASQLCCYDALLVGAQANAALRHAASIELRHRHLLGSLYLQHCIVHLTALHIATFFHNGKHNPIG
jgi:hypothetical protein